MTVKKKSGMDKLGYALRVTLISIWSNDPISYFSSSKFDGHIKKTVGSRWVSEPNSPGTLCVSVNVLSSTGWSSMGPHLSYIEQSLEVTTTIDTTAPGIPYLMVSMRILANWESERDANPTTNSLVHIQTLSLRVWSLSDSTKSKLIRSSSAAHFWARSCMDPMIVGSHNFPRHMSGNFIVIIKINGYLCQSISIGFETMEYIRYGFFFLLLLLIGNHNKHMTTQASQRWHLCQP